MKVILRGNQVRAIDMVSGSYRAGHRAPILVAPTGSGKTVMGAGVIERAVARGRNCLFLAHRVELIEQASNKLCDIGLRHGLIVPGGEIIGSAKVQVASVQTLVRRLDRYAWRPDLILIDECHLSSANTYKTICDHYGDAFLLGLTATPSRLDGKGLGRQWGGLFDDILIAAQMTDLIGQGFLVRPRIFAPSTGQPDLTGIHMRGGDYDQSELAEVMDNGRIIGNAVEHYKTHARGRPCMAFCVSIQHAEHTAEQFRQAGFRAVAVSGETPAHIRRAAVDDLGRGRVDVVCNCALYIEGLDQPAISCVVLLAPTQSLTRYLQSVGRGLRTHPGKPDCIVLDHAGNVLRHGLPQEEREWSLEGKARRKKKDDDDGAPVRQCQKCYAFSPITASACENCGLPFPKRARELEQVDGRLEEISDEHAEQIRRNRLREQGKAVSLEDLIAYGKKIGHRRPELWARHVYAARLKKQMERRPSPSLQEQYEEITRRMQR